MSLKSELNKLIQDRIYVPYEEAVKFSAELGYRVSNMERRLRPSDSPNVEEEMAISKRGTPYVKGYWWKPKKSKIEIDAINNYRPAFLENQRLQSNKLI